MYNRISSCGLFHIKYYIQGMIDFPHFRFGGKPPYITEVESQKATELKSSCYATGE